jgi:N,N'-diacetyllegionaminate synthase
MKPAQEVIIRGRSVGPNHGVYLIAEIACAHQGSLAKSKALVESAVHAAADAVQFEIFDAEHNMVPYAPLFDLITRLQHSREQWRELVGFARRHDIAVIGYAYDQPSLELALELKCDALKLNASDLCNPAMIAQAARSGLPFTLGTGAGTLEEIAAAVEVALAADGSQLVLMHGVQNFPTSVDAANIRRVRRLADAFGCLVGYADHTAAEDSLSRAVELVALGMGACVFEKHVCLSRADDEIDVIAALEPDEFRAWVNTLRRAAVALGPERLLPLNDSEHRYRTFQRKTIVAACEVAQGTCLTADMFAFMRHPEPCLDPATAVQLIGRKALRDLRKHELVKPGDLGD